MDQPADDVAYFWLPFDPARGWREAGRVAVAATEREAHQRGSRPCIVSIDRNTLDGDSDDIARAAKHWDSGTRKGRWPSPGGPVLAWLPDIEVLQRATRTARGSALIAVEFPETPTNWWTSWAAQLGAVDLSTGRVTPDERSEQVKEDIAYVLWNGNNGWPKRDPIVQGTVRYLVDVAKRGELDEAAFVAAAIIAGKSEDAIGRLRDMIGSARQAGR